MVLSDSKGGDIGWKKWLVAGWAFMECLLFGGLLYGWASVVFVLKDEGIYGDLCEVPSVNTTNGTGLYADVNNASEATDVSVILLNSSANTSNMTSGVADTPSGPAKGGGKCDPQDSNMALTFTIGSALFCVGCAVLGHVNYKFGTRVTRIISFALFVTGSLLMAFISKENPWLMFPGLSLLGMGGLPILVTNTQVSNLFQDGSSSVVGLLCGGFDMSSAVMLMVKIASENGFSRKNMFLVIAALHSLLLVSTFGFLPKTFISKRVAKKSHTEIPIDDTEVGVELINNQTNKDDGDTTGAETPSLMSCLKKPMFLTHVLWLCLLQLRFFYFIGTLNQYLTRTLEDNNDLVSYFTNVCFYTMMAGLVTSFFSGIVYDWQKRLCKDGKSKLYREVMPAVFPLAMGSLLSVILSILVLIPVQPLLYVIFIVMTLFRSFLYSLAAAFISALFPSQYFGMLYGIMIVAGGVFGCFQYVFFTWAEAYLEGPLHANIFLLCIMLLSFIHPLYLWITCWKEERKFTVN